MRESTCKWLHPSAASVRTSFQTRGTAAAGEPGTLDRKLMNNALKNAAKKAGIGNGNGKYGRMRVHRLRKFFITQLTNQGVQDKVVNFMSCHILSEIDRVYWSRRVYSVPKVAHRTLWSEMWYFT